MDRKEVRCNRKEEELAVFKSRPCVSASCLLIVALLFVSVLNTTSSQSAAPQISQDDLTPWAYLPMVRRELAPMIIRITSVYVPPILRAAYEYVEIQNQGQGAQDMTDWTLTDAAQEDTFVFPAFTLQPGSSVRVMSRCGLDSPDKLFWCAHDAPIWDIEGDTAYLRDQNGDLVDSYSYP
jgi:hypothetical protein